MHKLNVSPAPADFSHLIEPVTEGLLFPHWSAACKSLHGDLTRQLRILLGTTNLPLLMMISGTGAIEALLTNVLSVGDRVLVLSNGFFGDRLFRMSKSLGLIPEKVDFDWDRPIDPDEAIEHIYSRSTQAIRGVLMVHLETSTGILNQPGPMGKALRDSEILFLLDVVSSAGTSAITMDEWYVDGLACVSYKGLRSPPGLAVVAIGDRYLTRMKRCGRPSYSLSLEKAIARSSLSMTISTAPVNSMILLNRQLEQILSVGLSAHFAHCEEQATAIRHAIGQLGLEVFGRYGLGNCMTTVFIPQEIRDLDLVQTMETEFRLYIGCGLGKLGDSTFRLAHYGDLDPGRIQHISSCLESLLS